MVRGTSRRVIVVESPDTNLFEQAIFIVRNDALSKDALAQHAPAAAAVRLARVLERGGRARHCTGLAFDCAGLRETGLLLGGTLWASRPFCTVEKWQNHFFEKASLRSAPRLSAESGQFAAHSAQSVFCRAQVAAENGSYRFRVCGRETLRGFSIG